MKYQLETIPVTDAWASKEPCPLCLLMDSAEKRHIKYFLGNSVMNPETRVQVNKTGFCQRHFLQMAGAGAAHHLGLVGHTHLQEVRKQINGALNSLGQTGSARTARVFHDAVIERLYKCLICNSLEKDEQRYTYTAVILYRDETEFRQLFQKSQGPCLPHAALLVRMAAEVLKRPDAAAFMKAMGKHLDTSLEQLEADILHFTRKFDSQNDSLEWGNAKDAHHRVVQMRSGRKIETLH